MNIALILGIALLPALLWMGLFQIKDRAHPEPRKWLLLAFFSGALAILPVLGFSYLWKLFTGSEWLDWIGSFGGHALALSIFSVFWLAAIEEFFKHKAVLSMGAEVSLQFDELSDGIFYSVAAALGFAFLENAVYLWTIFSQTHAMNGEFWSTFAFRGFGTMLGHLIFSGIFGYFWGLALLVRLDGQFDLFKRDEKKGLRRFLDKFFVSSESGKGPFRKFFETISLYTIRSFLNKNSKRKGKLSSTSLVAEGFWLATLMHTIFNVTVSAEWAGENIAFLVVPILIFGFSFLMRKTTALGDIPLSAPLPNRK